MILDTSVIAKWFIEEEDTPKALKIRKEYVRGEIDVEIPDLLIYELANVLRYKHFSDEEIKDAISSIMDMDFLIIAPSQSLIHKAAQISLNEDVTIYDAVYIALSDHFSTPVVTADKKLYVKTKNSHKVILLSEYARSN